MVMVVRGKESRDRSNRPSSRAGAHAAQTTLVLLPLLTRFTSPQTVYQKAKAYIHRLTRLQPCERLRVALAKQRSNPRSNPLQFALEVRSDRVVARSNPGNRILDDGLRGTELRKGRLEAPAGTIVEVEARDIVGRGGSVGGEVLREEDDREESVESGGPDMRESRGNGSARDMRA